MGVLQVLAAEAKKEAMVPYIKVFQTLLRCASLADTL